MIDLKAARQESGRYRAALARRGAGEDFDALLAADARWRELTERSESLRAEQKRSSRAGPPGPDQLAELRRLADELTKAQAELAQADHERQALLDRIPNLPDPTAADGMAEEDAQTLRTWGERPSFGFAPRDATDLGSPRGWIDMARGARLSGSRFAYRFGDVALAELALYRFVLDRLTGKGFLPVLGPVMVGERAMYGTGFLPTDASNLYHLEKDDLYLTGTSEVALAGIHMDERLEESQLPARYTAFSTCFRREAGAAGKDTRGMFRVHQFDKVEMYVYCVPEQSREIHDQLLAHEEEITQALGLPYRVQNIAVGDLGGPGGQEVRHRGVVPGPGTLPRDHVVLEHHRLPGAPAQYPVPPRRAARVCAHAQRDRGHRPRPARDHGELPGRGRHGHRARGAPPLRRPRHPRRPGRLAGRVPVLRLSTCWTPVGFSARILVT